MSLDTERRAQRGVTTRFIAANPSFIVLIPIVQTKTGDGYTTADGEARDEQIFRLVDQSTELGNLPGRLRSSNGQERKATHQLVGYFDAVFAAGDHWFDETGRYEVDEILPDNGYERRAKVIRYGR